MDKTCFALAVGAAFFAATGAQAAPVQWLTGTGSNGHYYELITANLTWSEAKAAAEASLFAGLAGYLVSITSAEEQAFLNVSVNPSSVQAWIGATDEAVEGSYVWSGGPEDGDALGYTNWSVGEPNNFGGEDYAIGWWSGDRWNDLPGNSRASYIVEYSGTSAVPIPATLPLFVGGLAAFGAVRLRGKAKA